MLAGCSSSGGDLLDRVPPALVTTNIEADATAVAVDTLVTVAVENGTLAEVTLLDAEGTPVGGEGSDTSWTAVERLEPGTAYSLTATAEGDDGEPMTIERSFTSQDLTLDQQTYPSVAPLQGETVGVGMPVIVYFDLPVTDRATFEREMSVTAEPQQVGGWHWVSDTEVHYRPEVYWQPGSTVKVDLALNSLPAGEGIYGQLDQEVEFQVGRQVISTVDTAAHTMSVSIDGQVARTIPVTTGAPDKASRNGTKIIMEKFDAVDMDAASTGVDLTDPNYYNIPDVKWAMRLTNSGEFVHAAPWSVASQGRANVSSACVGMSTENAGWLYQNSQRGDVVVFTGSPRRLEPWNGWTDWNLDWSQWQAGSALAGEPAVAG